MNKKIFLVNLLFLPFFFVGCENEEQELNMNVNGNGNGLVPLNIVIDGMEDFGEITSPETRSGETMVQSFVQSLDSTQDTGIDMVTTVEMLPAEKTIQTRASLGNGAKFVMKIYFNEGGEHGSYDYHMDENRAVLDSQVLPILQPGTYKFIFCTYDDTTISPVVMFGDSIIVIPSIDFLTHCFSKDITLTDSTLNISFKRQMSLLRVAVSSDFDNDIQYSKIAVHQINRGIWPTNFNSTDDTEILQKKYDIPLEFSDEQPKPLIPISDILPFEIKELTIGGKNYGTKTVNVPVNFVKRGNYKITVHFTKKRDPIPLGDLNWAPGNLQYVNGKYSFMMSQEIKTNTNAAWTATSNPDYFSWNTLTPTLTSLDNGDPCSKVAPVGTWRTPTKADIDVLLSFPKVLGSLNGIPGYYFGVSSIPADADQNKTLFFPFNGLRKDNADYMFNNNVGGDYWTSSSDGTFGYYLFMKNDGRVPGIKTQDLNSGKSIRCVK